MTPDQIEETAAQLRRGLAANLAEGGNLRSRRWRSAVEAVPRHEFVPQFLRLVEGTSPTEWEPISLDRSGAHRWLELAYADESLVTQLDGTQPKPSRRSSHRRPDVIVHHAEPGGSDVGRPRRARR